MHYSSFLKQNITFDLRGGPLPSMVPLHMADTTYQFDAFWNLRFQSEIRNQKEYVQLFTHTAGRMQGNLP